MSSETYDLGSAYKKHSVVSENDDSGDKDHRKYRPKTDSKGCNVDGDSYIMMYDANVEFEIPCGGANKKDDSSYTQLRFDKEEFGNY